MKQKRESNKQTKTKKEKKKKKGKEKKENPKINLYIYDQLIFNKGNSTSKRQCFEQMVLKQSHFGKVLPFLKKLSINLLYYPVIPHLGIYPEENETYVHTKTCMDKFYLSFYS